MHYTAKEWEDITKTIEREKEKILASILKKDAELNTVCYSMRDLYIAQIEMIDMFLKTPQKVKNIHNHNKQYAKSEL